MTSRLGRFSIASLLLTTGLIALSIAYIRTSKQLYLTEHNLNQMKSDLESLKESLSKLKNSRAEQWPDPSKINVIYLSAPPTEDDFATGKITMTWQLLLPDSAEYRLVLRSLSDMGNGRSSKRTSQYLEGASVNVGVSKLTVTVFENAAGKFVFRIENSGNRNEVEVEKQFDLFHSESRHLWVNGSNQIATYPATISEFVLVYIHELRGSGSPSPDMFLSIEATSAQKTESIDDPVDFSAMDYTYHP